MNRRAVLAGLAGAGMVGGAGWFATRGGSNPGGVNDDLPVAVRALDARGSSAGELRVPVPGTATVLDLFATWCAPCKEQMSGLAAVQERFGEEVRFVSVTNERFGGNFGADDVRAWWRANGGDWTVAHDPESDLMAALGASGLPYLAVAGPDGTVEWTHAGVAGEQVLASQVEAVLES